MFLNQFYIEDNGVISISPEQASLFAKEIAGDFNPIHNPDSKRFCVPGDLLFSLVLSKYGLGQKMCFSFTGLVGKDIALIFPDFDEDKLDISDEKGKAYLNVERHGDINHDQQLIESLARDYVAFSGHNYPHILVPLMAGHNVMINPDRPLVIYEKMSVEFEHLNFSAVSLKISDSTLEVNGKRGVAHIYFDIFSSTQEKVGKGFKKLLLSGLREYDAEAVEGMNTLYETWKKEYPRT